MTFVTFDFLVFALQGVVGQLFVVELGYLETFCIVAFIALINRPGQTELAGVNVFVTLVALA